MAPSVGRITQQDIWNLVEKLQKNMDQLWRWEFLRSNIPNQKPPGFERTIEIIKLYNETEKIIERLRETWNIINYDRRPSIEKFEKELKEYKPKILAYEKHLKNFNLSQKIKRSLLNKIRRKPKQYLDKPFSKNNWNEYIGYQPREDTGFRMNSPVTRDRLPQNSNSYGGSKKKTSKSTKKRSTSKKSNKKTKKRSVVSKKRAPSKKSNKKTKKSSARKRK